MIDIQALLNLLAMPNILLDPAKQREAITYLSELINTDNDDPCIVQPSIQLLSSHQPLTRIIVMKLIQRHVGRNQELMPQVTNALLKCAVDPNPAVRKAAVSTLACVPGAGEVASSVLTSALRDAHPSVQRAAVAGCRVFSRTNPDFAMDCVDELYGMIRSEDPLLVHTCLMSLDSLLASEGGVVISRSMCKHLLNRCQSMSGPALVDVLRLLTRYRPGSEQESLDMLNRLDRLLASPSPDVVQAALELYFGLCCGEMAPLRRDVVVRAAGALCNPAEPSTAVRWLTLDLVLSLEHQHLTAFQQHYRYFLPHASDGAALSCRLVSFLWRLAGPDTVPALVRELTSRLHDDRLQSAGLRSLLRILRQYPDMSGPAVDAAVRLPADVLIPALCGFDLNLFSAAHRQRLLAPLLALPPTGDPRNSSLRSAALLRLVGRYGAELEAAPGWVNQLAGQFSQLARPAQMALVSAAGRLFVRRPAELQMALGLLLERAAGEGGELRTLAARVYSLLLTPAGRDILSQQGSSETREETEQTDSGAGGT